MEEDEEIDILGDFDISKTEREISNISAGQILSFEYTVNPIWLTDNLDGGGNFSDEVSQQDIQEDEDMAIYSTDSDEYNKQNNIEWPEAASDDNNDNIIILEDAIPAFIEEEVVTNTLVSDYQYSDLQQQQNIQKIKQNPRSLLKKNLNLPFKFKQTLKVDRSLLKSNQKFINSLTPSTIIEKEKEIKSKPKISYYSKLKQTKEKQIKKDNNIKKTIKNNVNVPKFKQSVKIKLTNNSDNSLKNKFNLLKKKVGRTRTKKNSVKKYKSGIVYDENITINHNDSNDNENLINKLILNQVENEKIIKIENDGESDVDVETNEPLNDFYQEKCILNLNKTENSDIIDGQNLEIGYEVELEQQLEITKTVKTEEQVLEKNQIENFIIDFDCSPELRNQLESFDVPTEEIKIDLNEITELEKIVHSEFFENRPTKTPERYKKIRAHILCCWNDVKPNYLSKTAVRNGLKNCGDVNCISRIHNLLEQIGAINFGCQEEHFKMIRPLTCLIATFTQSTRNNKLNTTTSMLSTQNEMERRQRIKNVTYKQVFDNNYTISHHNETHKSSQTTNDRIIKRQQQHAFDLIQCQQFTLDNIAPFKVTITLSTLLCLHLHSLSTKYEVMGFLGGHRSKTLIGKNKLSVVRYKPCKTSEQSSTTCEMCPISQVEQSTSLLTEGYELLGWFHTHPLFPPNPSRTDVKTQAEMQEQFSLDKPFVGFILGCINMQYKCIYIMPKNMQINKYDTTLSEHSGIPYQIPVDIVKDFTNFKNDIRDVFNVIEKDEDNFQKLLDKFTHTAQILLKDYDVDIYDLLKDVLSNKTVL